MSNRVQAFINNLIAQGENEAIEFKSGEVRPESLASEMVAFSNSSGGSILLGVCDEGKILGFDREDGEEWVANIARQNVIPSISPIITWVELDDQRVLLMQVPKGKDRPYQNQKHQFLVRVGSTNRVAIQPELLRLFQQSGAFHFDGTGV